MSQKTSIEWTHGTWNPISGCTQVSPGCDHCYAKTFAERFRGVPNHPYEQGFDLRLWPSRLDHPARWKTPRMIFVNSMSDLLHKDIPDDFILSVFETMVVKAPQHVYQVLTKRPSRLVNTSLLLQILERFGAWPAHIWLGVSVETMEYAWRVEQLRRIPVLIRFISAEPLLGELHLDLTGISWLIAGAESGHGARLMDEDSVRALRDQCISSQVAFFYKQNAVNGHKIPLPELDGRKWQQFPYVPRERATCRSKSCLMQQTIMPGERTCVRCGVILYCPECNPNYWDTDHSIYAGAFLCKQHKKTEIAEASA